MNRSAFALATLLGLAALGVASNSSATALNYMPLTAVPRGGDASCFADSGGKVKNTCSSTKAISFFTSVSGLDYTSVDAVVFSGSQGSSTLTCQAVSMSFDETAWNVGPQTLYNTAILEVDLEGANGVSLLGHGGYSIDCWLPAGQYLGSALVFPS